MTEPRGISVTLKNIALRNRVRIYEFRNLEHIDIVSFFAECKENFITKTREVLQELVSLKVNAVIQLKFVRTTTQNDENNVRNEDDGDGIIRLSCPMREITPTTRLSEWFQRNITDVIVPQIDDAQNRESGWTLERIMQLDVNYNKFNHFRGSSYIPLPNSIKNKKAIVNVKNSDNQCFRWAILSKIHQAKKNVDRLSNYERFKNELNFDDIEFPVSVQDIDKFEMLNPHISVNVYIIEKDRNINTKKFEYMLLPIRLTRNIKAQHVHLLLLFENDVQNNVSEDENSDDEQNYKLNVILRKEKLCNKLLKRHYVWIKNLSALIQTQVTKSNRGKKYICDRCLHYFYTPEKLNEHTAICEDMNSCKISLPDHENRWLFFENFKNKIEIPFIIYADIESLLVKRNHDEDNIHMSSTETPKGIIHQHVPNSVGYYFHSRLDVSLSFLLNV